MSALLGYTTLLTALVEGSIDAFVPYATQEIMGNPTTKWMKIAWDNSLAVGSLLVNLVDLVLNQLLFHSYTDWLLYWMLALNAFIVGY